MRKDPDKSRQIDIKESLICGSIAGAAAKTAIAPLDRVKIHFQVHTPAFNPYAGRILGVFHAIKHIYKTYGFANLYQGHSVMLLRIVPYAAINYSTYEYVRRFAKTKGASGPEYAFWKILPGSVAGATAVTLTYPLDITRVRMAYAMADPATMVRDRIGGQDLLRKTIAQLWNEGSATYGLGLRGLYQGYLLTLTGIVPYAGCSFASFEVYKEMYCKYIQNNNDPVAPLVKFCLGFAAGITAQTVTYPFDVIRRRRQVLRVAPHLSNRVFLAKNATLSALTNLFAGLSINYIKVAPATGISFAVYEMCKEWIFGHR